MGRAVRFDCVDTVLAVRVGEAGGSSCGIAGLSPLGVQLPLSDAGVAAVCSLDGDRLGECIFGREGEAGDSGRRKGEVRGEPKDRGDGLYEDGIAC